LKQKIQDSFGSLDACKKELQPQHTSSQRMAWLVLDGSKLKVVKTANAETPITTGLKPL